MPRTNYAHTIYTQETVEFKRRILGAMGYREIQQKDLAKTIQKTPATVSRYMKNIDTIPFGDLRSIANKLGIRIIFEGGDCVDEARTQSRTTARKGTGESRPG